MQHTVDVPCPVCHGTGRLAQQLHVTGYMRTQMLRILMSHPEGICSEEIFGKLYGIDPNGGPTTGVRVVAVLVWNANKQLKPQGYKIKCRWRGGRAGHSPYVLVKLDGDTEHQPSQHLHLGPVEGTEPTRTASDH